MGPLLLLLLGSLRGCRGRLSVPGLSVEPPEPLVPLGGSVQLNCSLDCPMGTVQWRGLDTNLGSVTSSGGHSVLRVTDATVAAEGTRICQGACGGRLFQRAVELRVYALPPALQLSAEPAAPGRPLLLRCAARGVYPPAGLALAWFRGPRLLRRADVHVEETEEGLFDVQDALVLPEAPAGADIRCRLTLTVRRETFSRAAALAVRAHEREPPAAALTTATTATTVTTATTASAGTATSGAATQNGTAATARTPAPAAAGSGSGRARSAAARDGAATSRPPGRGAAGAPLPRPPRAPAVAAGAAASLLGLVASAVASRRLCRRLHARYELS